MKEFKMGFHPFHLVSVSPWPLISSLSVTSMAVNFVSMMNKGGVMMFIFSLVATSLVAFQWWRDVIRESTFQGRHTKKVYSGLSVGMILFIVSEVMFFFSFFFGFFSLFLVPSVELGGVWPPVGIQIISCYDVPLLNTIILLSSGVTITWMHHSILTSKSVDSLISGVLTLILGFVFVFFQFEEYSESSFTFSDSVYGSIFFLTTGFHGLHVMVGASFILVSLIRLSKGHFSRTHHFGFEAAAWYWHFVDVVWLYLFVFIYWVGS
nr:cytochrome c oxidase subunit 3 [Strongylocotes lipogonus]